MLGVLLVQLLVALIQPPDTGATSSTTFDQWLNNTCWRPASSPKKQASVSCSFLFCSNAQFIHFRMWRQRLPKRPKLLQRWKRHIHQTMLVLLSLRCRWVFKQGYNSKDGVVHFLATLVDLQLLYVQPETASPTPMETSACEPGDLCQAFSDVILHTAIRDVDADDYDNPMLCSEYVKDIYKYLRQLEASILITLFILYSFTCT